MRFSDLKKSFSTGTLLIGFILVLWLGSFFLRERNREEGLFVDACVDAFYYDDGYGFDRLVSDLTKNLPANFELKMERELLGTGGYIANVKEDNIHALCTTIFGMYKDRKSLFTSEPCENERCTL